MNQVIHSFDADGYYVETSDMPPGAAGVNPEVATLDPLPVFDPLTHCARRVGSTWTIESIPEPVPEPETEPAPHQFPRFFGNAKLDLFTPAEQLKVVTSTMSDPVVKLMYDRLINAAFWTYEGPETEEGLAMLVSKGLLTPERKSAIVALMQPQ